MRKIFTMLAPLLVIIVACGGCKKDAKKDPTNSKSFYIKAKVNGTEKTMTFNPTSLMNIAGGAIHVCEIAGQFTDNKAAGVTLSLNDGAAYNTTTTYTEKYITVGSTITIQTTFIYKDQDNSTYLASAVAAGTNVTLKFTEIADDHLKGTFSGKLLKAATSSTFINITDGEFYVGRSL